MKRTRKYWSSACVMTIGAACMVGCAPQRGAEAIPSTAQTLASGEHGQLSATPQTAGTVYVYDAKSNRLIYSGQVQAGDKIVADPGASLVTVNAVTVSEPHLFTDHQYMIKFSTP